MTDIHAGEVGHTSAQARSVVKRIASFWAITSLVMFWFLLDGASYMAGIWLVIQAAGIVTLYGFGGSHLRKMWTGNSDRNRGSALLLGLLLTLAFILVFIGHWLMTHHQDIIF